MERASTFWPRLLIHCQPELLSRVTRNSPVPLATAKIHPDRELKWHLRVSPADGQQGLLAATGAREPPRRDSRQAGLILRLVRATRCVSISADWVTGWFLKAPDGWRRERSSSQPLADLGLLSQ